jgi:UDP-N-acetylmuramoylalanine--D-glutamate ligase
MKEEVGISAKLVNERGPSLNEAVVVVLGFGRSGRSASRLLAEAGARVRVTDASSVAELGVAPGDIPGSPEWMGREHPSILAGADLVVASPGVPPTNPVLARALESGLPVRSELELGWWFTNGPVIGITGTNGKTTTSELVGEMGRAAGRSVAVAGNVGRPVSSLSGADHDLFVLEVSSFQLFLCEDFRPHVGAILNLAPDHLDWHPDFEHYANSKKRMFDRQLPEDAAVLNGTDPEVTSRFDRLPAERFFFQESPAPERGAFIRDERLTFHLGNELESIFPLSEWRLTGRHNRENLLAAALCARLIGLSDEAIVAGARRFRGLPHRMEVVATIDGVTWINDSKSTNPASLEKALDPEVPTLLVAGGITKGCDFRPLRDAVAAGARVIYLIGEGAAGLEEAWQPVAETVRAGDLETAIDLAAEKAREGERVLFSPGCASFDQFENYAERGDRFRELVRERETTRHTEGRE